jgi:O-antigen/teichoic acid export membrane protein
MLLFIAGWFTYAHFVVGFVLSYLLIALILWLGLWRMGYWPFTFKVSRLTQRLRKPMMQFAILGYAWYLFSLLSQTIDGIIITKVCGLQFTAIFSIADYASRLMLVPQRSISAASIGGLGRAWKERDMAKIQEIYSKSALLQLLAGLFIFLNIWLNIDEALSFLPSGYEAAKYAIFWLCLAKLMELSAGCSNELLSTSPHWRLNLYAYVVLFVASIPLNIFLVMRYGILGSAIAGSIAYFLFNTARVWLVWYKAKLQPFSLKTIWLLLLALGSFALTLLLPSLGYRILDMALRSSLFSLLFLVGIYGLEISPDVNFLFNKFFGRFLGPFKRSR